MAHNCVWLRPPFPKVRAVQVDGENIWSYGVVCMTLNVAVEPENAHNKILIRNTLLEQLILGQLCNILCSTTKYLSEM